jgi:multidrug resistance protein MdtO
MGLPAVDLRVLWRRVVEPAPGRFAFAARLALVCAITAVLTAAYQTPSPALTAYVAFFVNKPDRMETVLLCIVMTLLITLILGFTTFVADLVLDSSASRMAAMTAVSLVMLFLVSASKLRPIGGIVALIVAYALDLLGSVSTGDAATRTLMYPWLFVAIPAGVSLVLGLLVAPSPRRLMERELARWLRTAASVLREPCGRALPALAELLRSGSGEFAAQLKLAALEGTSSGADIAALRQAADGAFALVSAVEVMTRSPLAMLPAPLRAALAAAIETAAEAFERAGRPHPPALDPADPPTLGPAAAATWAAIEDARAKLSRAAAMPSQAAATAGAAKATPTPAKQSSGFLLPDAFSNPDHVRFAIKTTAAAMFCYLTYSILDWPGIHTCFLTCYIVALPTVADSFEKLALRVAGCLVGAGLGIATMVCVEPWFTSVTALFVIVLGGALVGAWVNAGSPRIAYAGFQVAFAYLLCVVQDAGPAFDLVVARDRVIGMLFGMLVMYLVSARVWPISVARRIESEVRSAVQSLVAMTRAPDDGSRVRLAEAANASLDAAREDLAIAGYEPASVRPSERWLHVRGAMVTRAAATVGPLLLAAHRGDAEADIARRLERLGDATLVRADAASVPNSGALHALLEHISALEAAAAAARRLDEGTHAVA